MDLIPFYARLVATLHPCLDDIAPLLVDTLVRDLRFQVCEKDQVHVHSKLKNVRFIGECVHVCVCVCVCVWTQDQVHVHSKLKNPPPPLHPPPLHPPPLHPPPAELTKFCLCPKPETMKCITVSFS